MKKLIVTAIAVTMFGCSTATKSILLGGTLGLGTGVLVGSQNHDDKDKAMLIGGLVGLGVGGLLGYAGFKDVENKRTTTSSNGKESDELSAPNLSAPIVRRVWVTDKIEGNNYIRGHYIFVIQESSHWRN